MARPPQAGPSHALEDPELLPEPLARLSALLDTKPETALARGDADIRTASLAAAQFVFDRALKTEAAAGRHIAPFLASLAPSAAPRTRSQSAAKGKQKAAPELKPEAEWRATPLDALHVAGGAQDEQVWAQLDLRAGALCAVLGRILEDDGDPDEERPVAMEDDEDEDAMDEDAEDDGGLQAALDKLRAEGSDNSDEDSDEEPGSSELDAFLSSESSDGEHSEPEHELALRDPSDEDSDSSDLDLDGANPTKSPASAGRKSVLDDGFFSLAAFNAESDAAEARSRSSGKLKDDSEEDEEEDEDVDLFAAVDDGGDLDGGAFDEEDLEASGELYYKDFFDPPSRKALSQAAQQQKWAKSKAKSKKKKQGFHFDNDEKGAEAKPEQERKRTVQFHDKVRVKPIRPSPLRRRNLLLEKLLKEQGLGAESDSDEEEGDGDDSDEDDGEGAYGKPGKGWGNGEGMDLDLDLDFDGSETEEEDGESDDEEEEDAGRATIGRLKDDLFAEDEDEASGPAALSTHEIRQADLRAQIAALEAENAAPRAWALAGEAGARARPADALLTEDLEFDRAARPVPAVTEERVSAIEEVIKRRILENNFDDVERKRPENSLAPSRRAAFEISDQKSQKSLAQLYEDDYTAASGAGSGVGAVALEDRDGKLAKEHKELEKLWDAVCYKLDALCNAHFTPKAPTTKITTINNVPAASLESALPTATSAATMLAPEEVAARATARQLVARSEMTPEEKRRARQRGKERHKKRDRVVAAQGKVAQAGQTRGVGGVKKEKAKALSAVAKGRGVTVVGKVNGRDAKGMGKGKGKGQVPLDGKRLKL